MLLCHLCQVVIPAAEIESSEQHYLHIVIKFFPKELLLAG